MQKYIQDLINRIEYVEDELSAGRSPGSIFMVLKDAREQLGILMAARRKLIDQRNELRETIKQFPCFVDANVRLPSESKNYVVLIKDAHDYTTLYFDASFKCFFDDDTVPYRVSLWLEVPEVNDAEK
ncbi:MAG: hypothetical protein E7653_00125 [Ruminococcaceae bacterium]|nr:hypothetical protein [Oscillospiraceae bacterium]